MRLFPLLQTYAKEPAYVPWDIVAPHEKQALRNHGQTLERLAERGGLSVCELLAVLEDRDWKKVNNEEAWRRIYELLAAWNRRPDTLLEEAAEALAEVIPLAEKFLNLKWNKTPPLLGGRESHAHSRNQQTLRTDDARR